MSSIDKACWDVLSRALDDLLDLEPTARAARLAEIAHEDPPLAAELQELLREHEAVSRRVSSKRLRSIPSRMSARLVRSSIAIRSIGRSAKAEWARYGSLIAAMDASKARSPSSSCDSSPPARAARDASSAKVTCSRACGIRTSRSYSMPASRQADAPTSCSSTSKANPSIAGVKRARSIHTRASTCSCKSWRLSRTHTAS